MKRLASSPTIGLLGQTKPAGRYANFMLIRTGIKLINN